MSTIPAFIRQDHAPLFPDILYNRPVTRLGAGRLLVVGGHTGEFSQPTAINHIALTAGAGECRVVMPDKLAPILSGAPGVFFGPSTASGSLSRESLGRILELAEDSDALALAVSLSNNSGTTMLIERVLQEYTGPLVLCADGAAIAQHQLETIAARPGTVFILTMPEVLKFCGRLGIPVHLHGGAGLVSKLEIIRRLASRLAGELAVFGAEVIVASGPAPLTVTPINYRLSLQPSLFYGVLASFWVQNRTKRRQGLVTGAYILQELSQQFSLTDTPTLTQVTTALAHTLKTQEDW